MNKLFQLASGPYITRHDADDVSAPTRLAQQVAYLDTHPVVGLVSCQVQMIDALGAHVDLDYFSTATDNAVLQQQLLEHNCFCQGSVMFRKSCLDPIGLYDESLEFTEDYDLWLRMAEVTQMARLDEILYHYRHHAASVSNTRQAEQTLHIAQALEKTVQRRFPMDPPAALLQSIGRYYWLSAGYYYAMADRQQTEACLKRAIELWPALVDADETDVGLYPTEAGLSIVDSVFSALPSTQQFRRLKRRFVSALYMREVFKALNDQDSQGIRANLWPGVRSNPRWLLNRGVGSLLLRQSMGRLA
jgi:hypothetical protein